jgi:hypothetical protein
MVKYKTIHQTGENLPCSRVAIRKKTNAALPLPRRAAGLYEKDDLKTGCHETTQKQKHLTQEVARTKSATAINPCPRVAIQAHKYCPSASQEGH